MLNFSRFYFYIYYTVLYFNSFIRCISMFLIVVGFTAITEAQYDLEHKTPEQKEEYTTKYSLKKWFSEAYANVTGLVKSSLPLYHKKDIPKFDRNTESNDIYLQRMIDDNNLYNILEMFKEKPAIEAFTLVYMQALLKVDSLYQVIKKARLQVPEWLQDQEENLQKIKGIKNLSKIGKNHYSSEFIELLTTKDSASIRYLENDSKSFFNFFQSLLQYNSDSHRLNPDFLARLNKQVDRIVYDYEKKDSLLLSEHLWLQSAQLQNELSFSYLIHDNSMLRYPLITAFYHWCECYPNSKISKLLADSDRFKADKKLQIAEQRKPHQGFFEYLNCKAEINSDKVIWYDAEQSLRDDETNNIITELLNDNIIKNLISKLQTVESLVTACNKGASFFDTVHDEQEKQDRKDSVTGKLYYGISSIFKSFKNIIFSPITEKDKRENALRSWVTLLAHNAHKLDYKDKNIGYKLVMAELKAINKNDRNITLADAITKLVEQRFESLEKELAFTFLTGLLRTVNRESECYCYKPIEDAALHSSAYANEEQYKCDIEQFESIKKHNKYYAHVEFDGNQEEYESGCWLPLSKSDYLLKVQNPGKQNNNADSLASIDDYNEELFLHDDWNSIETGKENADEDKVNNTFSRSYSKKNLTITEKALRVAIGFSVVLMFAQGVSALTTEKPTMDNRIRIHNAHELGMIGKNSTYSEEGSYILANNFDGSEFKQRLDSFYGHLDGDCHVIYNVGKTLFEFITNDAIVENIEFVNARVNGSLLAEFIEGNSIIRNIKIDKSTFYSVPKSENEVPIGALACRTADSAVIEDVLLIRSAIKNDRGYKVIMGGLVGDVIGYSVIRDSAVVDSEIESYRTETVIGGVIGRIKEPSDNDYRATNITVISTTINSKRSPSDSVSLYLENDRGIGGVIGVMKGYNGGRRESYKASCKGIIANNVTISVNGIDPKKEGLLGGVVGGAIGATDGTVIRAIFVLNSIMSVDKGDAMTPVIKELETEIHLGGIIGVFADTELEDATCINTMFSGSDKFGFLAGSSKSSSAVRAFIDSSTFKSKAIGVFAGGVAGSSCNSEFKNIIVQNSVIDAGFDKDNMGDCVGIKCKIGDETSCAYISGHSFIKQDAKVYSFNSTYPTDQCIWLGSYFDFISKDCILDKVRWNNIEDFHAFDSLILDENKCSMPEKQETPWAIIVGGVGGAILVSYCGYHWINGCREDDSGTTLLMRRILNKHIKKIILKKKELISISIFLFADLFVLSVD